MAPLVVQRRWLVLRVHDLFPEISESLIWTGHDQSSDKISHSQRPNSRSMIPCCVQKLTRDLFNANLFSAKKKRKGAVDSSLVTISSISLHWSRDLWIFCVLCCWFCWLSTKILAATTLTHRRHELDKGQTPGVLGALMNFCVAAKSVSATPEISVCCVTRLCNVGRETKLRVGFKDHSVLQPLLTLGCENISFVRLNVSPVCVKSLTLTFATSTRFHSLS